jgi:hypothetical protein
MKGEMREANPYRDYSGISHSRSKSRVHRFRYSPLIHRNMVASKYMIPIFFKLKKESIETLTIEEMIHASFDEGLLVLHNLEFHKLG